LRHLDQLFPGDDAVLLDGAMGTELRELGWPVTEATVLANLEAPGLVATVHGACRAAGAQVLQTNTFGALLGADTGGAQRLDAVRAAVRIARKVARASGPGRPRDVVLVAGSLGAYDLAFHGPRLDEVVRLLVDEGVDLLVFETCNSVRDAQVALEVRAEYALRLPAVICVSSTDGSHEDRKRVEETAALVASADSHVELGLNCCRGPHEAFKLALSLPALPRWLKPSAGAPDDPVDDNVMAAFARAARQRGARYIGGCCGTGPETLVTMAAALEATAL
jgi:methionine synthase I (cobalamin-dependent)